jgi:hypothetical protein
MFKIGDKIKCVNASRVDVLLEGVVYEVRDVTVNYVYLYNTVGGYFHSRFVPVVQPTPTARANDQATSKGKRKVNKYEQAVLDCLAVMGPDTVYKGATGKQIAKWSGHPLNCITPRFAPLRRKGLIKPWQVVVNGEYTTIKRDKQIVWVLA